jgi:aubergine
LNVLVK